MGCAPTKNTEIRIAPPDTKNTPKGSPLIEDKLSSAKARILDSIKKGDLALFKKIMHTYQIKPTEVVGQPELKKNIIHHIAENNFANGMAAVLDYILQNESKKAFEVLSIKDAKGNTPAILCCMYDSAETLEILVKSGQVNLDIENNMGCTAQMIASQQGSKCLDIFSLNNQPLTRDASAAQLPISQLVQNQRISHAQLDETSKTEQKLNPETKQSSQLRSQHSIKSEVKISSDTKLYQILTNPILKNTNFVDEEFPHDNESISTGGLQPRYLKTSIKWIRPSSLLNPNQSLKLFEGTDVNIVSDSDLDGCDLYSALAALTEYPEALKKIFTITEVNNQGAYSIKLLVTGIPIEIVLDDYFPYYEDNQPVFSCPLTHGLWFSLIEKAFAKLYGSYSEIKNIPISDIFQILTGMPSFQYSLKNINMDEAWNLLLDYEKKNYIYCAGTLVAPNDKANKIFCVMQLYETEQHRLIKLKDHFEEFEWKGNFSSISKLWTSDLKKKVGFDPEDKSFFYVDIKEFLNHFDFISVCYYNENLVRTGKEVTCNHKRAVFFEFEIDQETEVFISVHQKFPRFVDEPSYALSPVEILVAENLDEGLRLVASGEKDAFLGKHTVYADDKVKTRLSEGQYVIRVKVAWVDKLSHDFTLNIFAPEGLDLKKVKTNSYPNFLERIYMDAGAQFPEKYNLGNKCEFASSWCGQRIWLFGINKGKNTWNLEIVFKKLVNLKLCKKHKINDKVIKMIVPPQGKSVAYIKRINSEKVEFNWIFNQSWS